MSTKKTIRLKTGIDLIDNISGGIPERLITIVGGSKSVFIKSADPPPSNLNELSTTTKNNNSDGHKES